MIELNKWVFAFISGMGFFGLFSLLVLYLTVTGTIQIG